MKQEFVIHQSDMSAAIGVVSRAAVGNPVKPAYGGILIEANKDGLVLTASNGEFTFRTRADAMVTTEGAVLYPAKLIGELVRRQSAGEIRVSVDDRGLAKLSAGSSRASVQCMERDDFPTVAVPDGTVNGSISAARLKEAVNRVLYAASTDEGRKIFTGVMMEVTPSATRLVAIDGFRMAVTQVEAINDSEHEKRVIPGRFMGEVARMLPDDDSVRVGIEMDGQRVKLTAGDIEMYSILLQGEFIDYEKMIPKSAVTEVLVGRVAMLAAIERCGLIARQGKGNLLTLNVGHDGIVMTARAETSDAREEIPAIVNGNELTISFSAAFLTDAVKYADGDEVRMLFTGSVSPGVVKPRDGGGYTFLVLPVRTTV